MPIIILLLSLLFVVAVAWWFKRRRKQFNEKLKLAPFKSEWVAILQKNMGLYSHLPEPFKQKLHGLIQVFLHEKTFSGYNGLEISDEIRVTIAAQACLLMLNRDEALYPSLYNILVYPDAFKSMQTTSDGVVHTTRESVRLGESWHRGHVVLSWQHSMRGGEIDDDGHNVVYHEFAHQLDSLDGAVDGTPELDSKAQYASWVKVFEREFLKLREQVSENSYTLIDAYGAESEGEFFAVVTELFFEKPRQLQQQHPALYQELVKFYHLNPVEWLQ